MTDSASSTGFTAACVQLCGGRDVAGNVAQAATLIREAAGQGADLVITPEQTGLIELSAKDLLAKTTTQDADPALKAFRALAAELGIWLNIGSLAIKIDGQKLVNRSFLLSPNGTVEARYDKIHMFDVDLPGGERYRESNRYQAGNAAVTCALPWGMLGFSICYDLRFPALYRTLAQAGADFIVVPSAFTKQTGEAHWHVLLRARAIETGCYIFAAAHGGRHEVGRETYGHSLIISPWGEVLREKERETGIILADIDPREVTRARARIPALSHDQEFVSPKPCYAPLQEAS